MSAPSPQQRRVRELVARDGAQPYVCTISVQVRGASQARVAAAARAAIQVAWPSEPAPQLELTALDADTTIIELVAAPGSADTHTLDGFAELVWLELSGAASEHRRAPSAAAYARVSAWLRGLADDDETHDERERWAAAIQSADRVGCPLACSSDAPFRPRTRRLAMTVDGAQWERAASLIGGSAAGVVATAWATLIARLHAREQVVIGLIADGRSFTELEGVLGPLTRQLPLTLEVPGHGSFSTVVRAVEATIERGRAAEHSFDPSHAGSDTLTPIVFEHAAALPRFERGPLRVEVRSRCAHIDRFELGLELRGELLTLHYDAARISDAAAERVAGQFETLLAAACAQPERPLSSLDPLGADEARWQREQLDARSDATPRSLTERLNEHVRARPEQLAVVGPRTRLTYAELDAAADTLASALAAAGCERVGVITERGPAFIVAIVAAMRAGVTWVPLEPGHPISRLIELARVAGLGLVVHDPSTAELAAELGTALGLPMTSVGVGVGAGARLGTPQLAAYMIFTSGSTGTPKAVAVSHAAIAAYTHGLTERLQLEAPVIAAISSLATDLPLSAVFGALATGGTLVLPGAELSEDADGLAAFFASLPRSIGARIDALKIVPSQLGALLDAAAEPRELIPTRQLLLGGEAPELALVERVCALVPSCEVFNHYGPTEATVGVCVASLAPAARGGAGTRPPIGRPLAGVCLHILDDAMRPVATGAVGELYIGGPSLAIGYDGQAKLTAAQFVPDPFGSDPAGARLYRSGDRARLLADGQVQLLGRVDDQVKVHGVRVEIGEVETALRRCEGVAGCAVARHDQTQTLIAWIVPTRGATVDPEALSRALCTRLPRELIPTRLIPTDALPRTPSGKIDRRALLAAPLPDPRRGGRDHDDGDHGWTATERLLAGILCGVLGCADVGRHDNFFELGGDSIASVSVIARARRAGVQIGVRDIFDHPTVAGLARAAAAAGPRRDVDGPSASGTLPLLASQAWLRGLASPDPSYFNQALAIGLERAPAIDDLQRALDALASRHEALRLCVDLDGGHQRVDPGPRRVPLVILDAGEASDQALAAALAKLHTSFDLDAGPLLGALLASPGRAGCAAELFMVAHHVCVDAVSWRILLEDLDRALTQAEAREPIELPAIPTPLSAWAVAAAPQRSDEPRPRPCDDVVGDTTTVEFALSPEHSAALLRCGAAAFDASTQALLLGTVLGALALGLGRDELSVDIEGHGRQPAAGPAPTPDLTRTVGWLTARSSVHVARARDAAPLSWVAAASQALAERAERADDPSRPPSVSFTYFGAVAAGLEGSRFAFVEAAPGPARHPDTPRSAPVEVLATLANSRLTLTWTGSTRTIGAELLRRCATEQQRALVELADRVRLLLATDDDDRISDLLELAPLQSGILADCLAADRPGLYVAQTTLALTGPLDLQAMRRAWTHVVEDHTALRTTFAWEGLSRPIQLVHARFVLPFTIIDARGCGDQELAAVIERERDAARVELMALGRGPLLRVCVIQAGEDDWRLVWSRHHLVLDGWSAAIVLREVFETYARIHAGAELPPARAREGSRYGLWVRAQRRRDPDADLAFWRGELDGYPGGGLLTEIGGDRGERDGHRRGSQGRRVRALSPTLSSALERLALTHALTPSAIIQALYAVVLSRCSGREELVFGVTASGRGIAVAGVERMVGLLINTLPLRAKLEHDAGFIEWARALQARRVRVEDHHGTSLASLRALVPRAPLFDTVIVGGNYPVDRSGAGDIGGLRLGAVEMLVENSVPLTLRITPGDALTLEFLHDEARFDAVWVEDRLDDLERSLAWVVDDPALAPAKLRDRLRARPMWGRCGALGLAPSLAPSPGAPTDVREIAVEGEHELDRAAAIAVALAHRMRMVDQDTLVLDLVLDGAARPVRFPRVSGETFAALVGRVSALLDVIPAHVERGSTSPVAIVVCSTSDPQREWPPARTLEYRWVLAEPRARASVARDLARVTTPDHVQLVAAQLAAAIKRVSRERQILVAQLPPRVSSPRVDVITPQRSLPAATLHEQLSRAAARSPEQTAVALGDAALSYAALDRAASHVAQALLAHGLTRGEVVGISHAVGPDLLALVYGVLRAGGTILPLTAHDPRLASFVAEAGARVILSDTLRLGAEAGEQVRVIAPASLRRELAGPARPLPQVDAGQPAWLVFTSGSTGRPKAVAISHAAAVHYAAAVCERLDAAPGSSWATLASFAVDLGYTAWLGALATTGSVHLLDAKASVDAVVFQAYMAQHRIDYLKIVPSHLEALIDEQPQPDVLPRRALILGGEAMSWALVERVAKAAPGCQVFNHYGPSETTVGVVAGRVSLDDRRGGSVRPALGWPLAGVRVAILDEQGELVPVGAAGELCVGGPTVGLGYWRRPGQTAASFVPDPCPDALADARLYRTGDRARMLADGRLVFHGRLDAQLAIRGYRIEPGEIEAALLRGGSIRQVRVVSRSTGPGARAAQLVAYAVANHDDSPSPATLLRELASRLPAHMIPADLVWLTRLPLSAGGKLDVHALPAQTKASSRQRIPAQTPLQAALLAIWAGVLEREPPSIDDDFFAIGGDSLKAVVLTSRLRTSFQIKIPVQLVFDHSTPASMATALLELPEAQRVSKIADVLAEVRARVKATRSEAPPTRGSSMKVLMVTQPGEGHLNPMIPAAHALLAAGHELAVVSSAQFAPRIQAKGLRAIPAGLDYLESEVRAGFPQLRDVPDAEVGAWFLGELFADLTVHAMVPELLEIIERERPDLLVRTNYEFASCIVGELRQIPVATIHCAFMTPPRYTAEYLEQPLSFARSAWGLAPFPALKMLETELELSQAPLAWHEHVGANARAVRPAVVTPSGEDPLAEASGFCPSRPLVYASMGTVNNTLAGLFPTLLEALRDEPINLVMTVGRNIDPARFGPQPDNVLIRPYIPQDLLLPRCAVFINNASFFTNVAAILHGVPVLLCPLAGDTPSGAAQFARLGFGRVLRQPGPPQPPLDASVPIFDVDNLRAATRDLLGSTSSKWAERAAQGRDELLALPAWSEAVTWLEQLAARRGQGSRA